MSIGRPGFWGAEKAYVHFIMEVSNMKKMKRLVAVLLAGIMALAVLTACGGTGNDAANAEFEAKVEQAYMAKLNETFGTEFKNDDAIKNLAVEHIKEMGGKKTLSNTELWAAENPTKTTLDNVMICFDPNQSTVKAYVKLYYEADKAATITPNKESITALDYALKAFQTAAEKAGKKAELTALGVGAETIGGKTYVAIGFRVNAQ